MEIDDKILDIIEDNLGLLGTGGVWDFSYKVLYECAQTYGDRDSLSYTLGLFLMNMFDDDIDEIVRILASEGFHKWSHLDKWNSQMDFDIICDEKGPLDLCQVLENLNYHFGGVPSSKTPGEFIKVNVIKYQNLFDFSEGNFGSFCNNKTTSIPVVFGYCAKDAIPEDKLDKWYVAIPDSRFPQEPDLHYASDEYGMAQRADYNRNIVYVPVRDVDMNFFNTILPLEIVKKYNLPYMEEYRKY